MATNGDHNLALDTAGLPYGRLLTPALRANFSNATTSRAFVLVTGLNGFIPYRRSRPRDVT